MSNKQLINYEYKENLCELRLIVPTQNDISDTINTLASSGASCCGGGATTRRCTKNLRNFDVYIENNYFLIYLDVRLYVFHSLRYFNIKAINEVVLVYQTKEQLLMVTIPCLPLRRDTVQGTIENSLNEKTSFLADERSFDLWKLKRITDCCSIQIDNGCIQKCVADFGYGFASKFYGKLKQFESDADTLHLLKPQEYSPLKRSIERYIDEMKAFCPEQYKLNFVELQVPDGHNNPMKLVINYKDTKLTTDEEHLLHNITCKEVLMEIPTDEDQVEIDCGLISILLAIFYDVRSTYNDATCESAWTRSTLSSLFNYFETFQSIRDVVISFYRRSLTYPYYRSYKFSRQCLEDCVAALQNHPKWILKQLLMTCQLFENSGRSIFNYYYINDYIYYVANRTLCPATHLEMLGLNLKNVLFDITAKHLGLNLGELDTDIIKELWKTDIESSNSDEDDDDDDIDDDDDDDDDDDGDNDDDDDVDASEESEHDDESDENDNDDDEDDEDDEDNFVDDHINNDDDDDNDDIYNDDDECNDDNEDDSESYESELCNSNEDSSDTEENSVIEKQMQNMKI